MLIAGVDPGANGAIAVLDSSNPDSVALLDLAKVTPFDAYQWLHKQQPNSVWIEDVHSLYGMSAKSNFGFGKNLGIVTAIAKIAINGQAVKTVVPKVWQKYVGVTVRGKAIKKQVAEIANTLYPTANLYGKRGGLLDGRADALMIAHYGLHNKEKV
jgi:Holliday junction resolvasome RuvABC endonuclease subunit